MTMNSGNAISTSLAHGRHDLIGSDRVEGTNVYRSDGKKIGEIERVMIDKVSGQAAYAVMGFGGFLGMGEDHYPIPWQRLTYNEKLGGYEVNLTDEQLKNAPKIEQGKAGSERTGTATRRSMVIESDPHRLSQRTFGNLRARRNAAALLALALLRLQCAPRRPCC
jgi:hypothetical protein